MSKLMLRTVQTAILVAFSTVMLTGTAQAGNAIAVGCYASHSTWGSFFTFNFLGGGSGNGNNIGSNCTAIAIAH